MKKMLVVAFCAALIVFSAGCAASGDSATDKSKSDISSNVVMDPPSGDTIDDSDDPIVMDLNDEDQAFVSAGETIKPGDKDAWLLAGAMGDEAVVRSTLKLRNADGTEVTEWSKETTYKVAIEFPDQIFHAEAVCSARIFYPSTVKSGEKIIIATIIETADGYAYFSSAEATAKDDLLPTYLPNGKVSDGANGENAKISFTGNTLEAEIYTSAIDTQLACDGFFELTDDASGELFVEFADNAVIVEEAANE